MPEENLAQADVYYIILDASAGVTLEPDIEMNGVAPGHSIMSLACSHADVFDITYDEENTITDAHGSIEVIPCWKWLLD